MESSLAAFTSHPILKALLDATGVSLLVLNRERQIIVGNSELLSALDVDGVDAVLGMRPGEAIGCIHAASRPGGCGTAPECAKCGAVLAVLEAQRTGESAERECLMSVQRGDRLDAYELRVKASQVEVDGQLFTVVGLRDVSAEKRRETLERIFLHDISNTLGALLMRTELLSAQAPKELSDTTRSIRFLAQRMRLEIEDQRVLLQAEQGTLQPTLTTVQPQAALRLAAEVLDGHAVARERALDIQDGSAIGSITTDESILVRVLVNMMKNALEATAKGGVVRAWAEPAPGASDFRVWNESVIEAGVAIQIFKRSFSTKPGRGRGLGTFSMKLLGERYLGGRVGMTSMEGAGTTFFIRLPV